MEKITIAVDDAMIEFYLNQVLEDGDEAEFKHTLGYIAKAKGMSAITKDIGVNREGLYRTLDGATKAQFDTISKLIKSFGFTLKVSRN
ncbi:MAG: putative addiction module antidote protein [Endomicrobium sp.]|jgi:probable addiction module antidote protein|nr:putative addiction module antidote protein [Endomicrobium sp.]